MQFTIFNTSWGTFGFVVRERRLVATLLPQREASIRRAIKEQWPGAVETSELLPRLRTQVTDYFTGKRTGFTVDVDLSDVPPYRRNVLEACRRIPYGKTASYGDLARAAGNPSAARAAGSAMAGNPLPLVVPCHRVICSDGSLGGFSSPRGVDQKLRFLAMEGTTL